MGCSNYATVKKFFNVWSECGETRSCENNTAINADQL